MPEDKIESALKEIGFCENLQVKIQDGLIIAIVKGRYQRPEKYGIKTEIIIEKDITK